MMNHQFDSKIIDFLIIFNLQIEPFQSFIQQEIDQLFD